MKKTSYQPASFGLRLFAFLVDNLILSIVLAPVLVLIFGKKQLTEEQLQTILETQGMMGLFSPSEILTSNILGLMVTAFLWIRFGGTPMKRILGLRVIDAKTGKHLTPIQAILRYIGYFVSYMPMGLGFLWVIFDKKNQAWHDKIAGTLVIIEPKGTKLHKQSDVDDDTFAA